MKKILLSLVRAGQLREVHREEFLSEGLLKNGESEVWILNSRVEAQKFHGR